MRIESYLYSESWPVSPLASIVNLSSLSLLDHTGSNFILAALFSRGGTLKNVPARGSSKPVFYLCELLFCILVHIDD